MSDVSNPIDNVAPADNLHDGADRYNGHYHGYDSVLLSNQTGGALVVGDVVGLSTATDSAVVLADNSGDDRPMVVAVASIAGGATGEFARQGRVASVKATGAVSRGAYIRKSATTKTVESTGVTMGSGTPIPNDAIGVALTAASGGVLTAMLFGFTMNVPSAASVGAIIPFTTVSIQLLAGASNKYFGSHYNDTAATEALRESASEIVAPFTGTLRDLSVYVSLAPGNSLGVDQTWVFTLRKNEANTALTCTVTNPSKQASDHANTVAVTADDRLSIKVANPGGAATPTAMWAAVRVN